MTAVKKLTNNKVVFFSVFAILCFTSCKKNGICTCDNGVWGIETFEYNDLKKKDFENLEENCINYDNCAWTEVD